MPFSPDFLQREMCTSSSSSIGYEKELQWVGRSFPESNTCKLFPHWRHLFVLSAAAAPCWAGPCHSHSHTQPLSLSLPRLLGCSRTTHTTAISLHAPGAASSRVCSAVVGRSPPKRSSARSSRWARVTGRVRGPLAGPLSSSRTLPERAVSSCPASLWQEKLKMVENVGSYDTISAAKKVLAP